MKKFLSAVMATVLAMGVVTLSACGNETPAEDHVAPVIAGIGNVNLNVKNATFDIYEGVTVSDADDEGKVSDITSSLNVITPAGVAETDGKVTFDKTGDYIFTYYVKDNAGNLTVENRKVTVVKEAQLSIVGLTSVRIDRETEEFDVYGGVTVLDTDDEGNIDDLTSALTVTAPEEVTIKDGKVKFEKTGDYIFTYYANDGEGNFVVNSRKVEVRNIYNCYWVNATIPVLYCALDMVSNDYKSMLVFTRTDTLNISEMDDDRFIYKANGADVAELDKAKKYMARIANADEHSYFRAFICDAFNQIELFSFVQYGIPESRYEVKLVSDGSWTYNTAFPYRDANSWELWQSNSELYNGIRHQAFLNEYVETNTIAGVQHYQLTFESLVAGSHYYNDAQLSTMAIMAAQRSNIEMWCAYPETLTSANAQVQAEIDKANMPKMAPDAMYAKLSAEQKAEFLKICNFDKTTFDTEYFDKAGEYLIITGTNPFTGGLTDAEFADILKRIVADYEGYNILYKPHPAVIAPDDSLPLTKAVLEENGIKILPGRLPMEVISWVYNDVKLGGFDSSLFMAVPQGNTQFFIAQGVDSLSVLSKQLYNSGAFGTPKFYWKPV